MHSRTSYSVLASYSARDRTGHGKGVWPIIQILIQAATMGVGARKQVFVAALAIVTAEGA